MPERDRGFIDPCQFSDSWDCHSQRSQGRSSRTMGIDPRLGPVVSHSLVARLKTAAPGSQAGEF
jgi:hypothetical protein